MTYLKGSWAHHQPSYEAEGHPDRTCLYCGEPWPCDPAALKADLLEAIEQTIRPREGEPMCCDQHAAMHAALGDLADTIKEL